MLACRNSRRAASGIWQRRFVISDSLSQQLFTTSSPEFPQHEIPPENDCKQRNKYNHLLEGLGRNAVGHQEQHDNSGNVYITLFLCVHMSTCVSVV